MKQSALLIFATILVSCSPAPDEALREATHYWDATDFADKSLTEHPERIEARFAGYVELLQGEGIAAQEAGPLLANLLERAGTDEKVYHLFSELSEKYLYSPESPVRDEELYLYALRQQIESDCFDDYEKLRPRFQLNMALRNRYGEPATDFAFTLPDGSTSALYDVEAPFTILFFNDPGCEACREVASELRRRPLVRLMERAGMVRILAVYSHPDEDLPNWKSHLDRYPASWIMGYDKGARLHYEALYDLRTIPCLYLLDARKRVLCKGAVSVAPLARALHRALF